MATKEASTNTEEEIVSVESSSYLAVCKWYSNRLKYGFLTILGNSEHSGKDAFVHVSNLNTTNNPDVFACLHTGEYVQCELEDAPRGVQVVNVTGPSGHPLMCEHVFAQQKQRFMARQPVDS